MGERARKGDRRRRSTLDTGSEEAEAGRSDRTGRCTSLPKKARHNQTERAESTRRHWRGEGRNGRRGEARRREEEGGVGWGKRERCAALRCPGGRLGSVSQQLGRGAWLVVSAAGRLTSARMHRERRLARSRMVGASRVNRQMVGGRERAVRHHQEHQRQCIDVVDWRELSIVSGTLVILLFFISR